MVTIRGVKWNVTVQGEGKCIVLLHGWGQNQYMMKFLADHFMEDYQMINMDLPGFGESEEPKTVWSIEDYADALHDLLDSYDVKWPILIAHSFGARIAIRYAIKYPVSKMILTGAAGIRKPHGLLYHLRVYTYKLCRKLHLQVDMGSIDYQNSSAIMRGVLVASVNDDLTPYLSLIRCVTLLVWGEKDQETPIWMGRVMEEHIPEAALVVLKKGDHFAYFHQSMQFVRIIEAFLHG